MLNYSFEYKVVLQQKPIFCLSVVAAVLIATTLLTVEASPAVLCILCESSLSETKHCQGYWQRTVLSASKSPCTFFWTWAKKLIALLSNMKLTFHHTNSSLQSALPWFLHGSWGDFVSNSECSCLYLHQAKPQIKKKGQTWQSGQHIQPKMLPPSSVMSCNFLESREETNLLYSQSAVSSEVKNINSHF